MARTWRRVALVVAFVTLLVRCGGRTADTASAELAMKCVTDPAFAAIACTCDGGPCGDGGTDGGPDGGDGGPDGGGCDGGLCDGGPGDAGPDGGSDGGCDGGSCDGGSGDGGQDGGSDGGQDGGPSDGGSGDGGSGDGGSGDGGSGDGGTSDGGSSDGGASDGGRDGGGADGGGDGGASDGGDSDGGDPGDDDGGTGGGGGGGGGECTCSGGDCRNPDGASCLDLKVVPVDRQTGNIESTPDQRVSASVPMFNGLEAEFNLDDPTNYRNGYLSGTLYVSGYVHSGVCNTTPGEDGVIKSIKLYVDDNPEPVQIIQLDTSKREGNLAAPYFFEGMFSQEIRIENLAPNFHGQPWALFRLEANDCISSQPGRAEFRFDFNSPSGDRGGTPMDLQAGEVQPIAVDGQDFTYPSVIRVSGPGKLLDDPDFRVRTLDGLRKIVKRDGQYYVATRDGNRPEVMLLFPAAEPDGWIDDPDGEPGRDHLGKDQEGWGVGVLAAPAGAGFGGWQIPDQIMFLGGFAQGFCEGGIDLVWGNIKMAASIWWWSQDYSWRLVTAPKSTLKQTWAQANEYYEMAWNVGQFLFALAVQAQEFADDVAMELPRSLTLPMATMPPTLRVAMELGSEVFRAAMLDAFNKWADQSAWDMGRDVGFGMFQVFAILAPMAELGKLKDLGKLEFLTRIEALPFLQGPTTKAVIATLKRVLPLAAKFCTMCYPAGTAVLTEHGPVPIERLVAGDRVLSEDPVSHQRDYRAVIETAVTHPDVLYRVRFRHFREGHAPRIPLTRAATQRSPSTSGKRLKAPPAADDDPDIAELRSTAEHPYYSETRKAFVPASELRPGERLKLALGDEAVVVSVQPQRAPAGKSFTTYDLTVEGFHSYFVGDHGVWVHNAGPFDCKMFRAQFIHVAVDYVPRKYGRVPTNWETMMVTFQILDRGGHNYPWRAARDRLIELQKHFPNARPYTYQYDRLKGTPLGTPIWLDNPSTDWLRQLPAKGGEGLQGMHWWPQRQLGASETTGGAIREGAVFPVSTPYLHIRGMEKEAYGMHPVLWDYLRDYWKKPPDFPTAKLKDLWAAGGEAVLKDEALFNEQQKILKAFYKDAYSLDMPTFVYDTSLPFQGRGVYRSGM